MFNILTEKLPIIGKNTGLRMDTDFRNCIKFELLMQENEITQEEKILFILNLFFYDLSEISDYKKAIEDILWIYSCGKDIKNETAVKDKDEIKEKQIYSYEFDSEYIYGAFLEQYNIDLSEIDMHWWKFKALFNNLNENVKFSKILGYRSVDLSKIKDKKTKIMYRKMKKLYALPDMRTEEEKENDFANLF